MKILAALLVVTGLAVPMRAEIIEQVLVKVNGDIITKTDLEQRQIAALRERLKEKVDVEAMKNDAELKKALLEITPDLLVSAIDEMLLTQLGKEKGYKLSDEQFKSWLENLRKEQNLQDDQKFQSALRQEGMTVDDLRKNVEKQFLLSRVQQDEVGSKLTMTEEDARQYYAANASEFAEPATVTLREILIDIPEAAQKGQAGINVGAADDAEKKAVAIRARVVSGEDFGKLAAEQSDSPSKANGGLIGPLPMSDLSDALRKTLESMKPGEVTQPVRTARGFQVLKLESMKTAATQSFESVRDLVADRVHGARQQAEARKFLTRLRSQALIEWKNPELKKLYEQRIAAGVASSN
ncbi:MAG TPA: peptidylprolyl isomerase [Vicinamibacterales bacterium]|nr:peptidylprolyl isomerase [Vicinamibacterales bacterium]